MGFWKKLEKHLKKHTMLQLILFSVLPYSTKQQKNGEKTEKKTIPDKTKTNHKITFSFIQWGWVKAFF